MRPHLSFDLKSFIDRMKNSVAESPLPLCLNATNMFILLRICHTPSVCFRMFAIAVIAILCKLVYHKKLIMLDILSHFNCVRMLKC
jgi:hypothetical protein